MVATLRRLGIADERALEAMGRVPREAFVPRFWSLPLPLRAGTPGDVREWHVDTDDAAIDLVYDVERALAIRRDTHLSGPTAGAGVTSTASAPRIVASMLELLALRPGMKVLEIGTGSGYNAALLRELVGPDGLVASVDIDDGLVREAGDRLRAAGHDDVRLAARDGYDRFEELAPFDRVVATVGCVDLAPAWLAQLADGGSCLLPLQHDGWHPLTLLRPATDGATGTIVGRSGFVAIQGRQARTSPWSGPARLGPMAAVEWFPLEESLAARLRAEPDREAIGALGLWDLAYLVALEDRRAASTLGLADGASSAAFDPTGARVGCTGPDGPALRDRLLALAARWIDLGCPAVRDYRHRFTPLASPDLAEPAAPADTTAPHWSIDRVDFRQTVRL